jgi:hypothetical protein
MGWCVTPLVIRVFGMLTKRVCVDAENERSPALFLNGSFDAARPALLMDMRSAQQLGCGNPVWINDKCGTFRASTKATLWNGGATRSVRFSR